MWDQLTADATARGITVAAMIRERLRNGMVGRREPALQMEVMPQAAGIERPTGMKTIAMFELSE